MIARGVRFCTSIVMIGLCGYAVVRAAAVFSFAVAERLATPDAAQTGLRPFLDGPEFGARAQLDLLAFNLDRSPVDRARNLRRLLALTPLASGVWLDLAVARLSAGEGADKSAASLALSNLTGPNESAIMAGRAVFALPLWSALPADLRRRSAIDLVGGWDSLNTVDRAGLKLALSAAPGETRMQIGNALLLAGANGAKIQLTLGLAPQASPVGQKDAN